MQQALHIFCSIDQVEGTVHGGGKPGLAHRRNSASREYQIKDLKKIIGDQSIVIDAFKKKASREDKLMIVEDLKQMMPHRNISVRILLQTCEETNP